MIHTIYTTGADIHVMERPNGAWTIQQGRSHVLITAEDARRLAQVLEQVALANDGGETVGPIVQKPPIMRYRSPVTSREILDYVNSRRETVAADVVEQFGLSPEAAAKQLQRLYDARFVGKPQHGVYSPLKASETDVFDGMG